MIVGDKCRHDGCTKKVNNKPSLCVEHKLYTCRATDCRTRVPYKVMHCDLHKHLIYRKKKHK